MSVIYMAQTLYLFPQEVAQEIINSGEIKKTKSGEEYLVIKER